MKIKNLIIFLAMFIFLGSAAKYDVSAASCGSGNAGVCQTGSFVCPTGTSRIYGGADCASGTICCSATFVDADTGFSVPSGSGPVADPRNTCSGTCRTKCAQGEGAASGPGDTCAAGQSCCVSNAAAPIGGAGATPVSQGGAGATPVNEGSGSGVYIPTAKETGLSGASIQSILINLLRWLLGIVGVVALIGFAISGVQYILAAGSDDLVTAAKKNMVNSIIGIVIVLASLVIVQAIDYALRAQGSF